MNSWKQSWRGAGLPLFGCPYLRAVHWEYELAKASSAVAFVIASPNTLLLPPCCSLHVQKPDQALICCWAGNRWTQLAALSSLHFTEN